MTNFASNNGPFLGLFGHKKPMGQARCECCDEIVTVKCNKSGFPYYFCTNRQCLHEVKARTLQRAKEICGCIIKWERDKKRRALALLGPEPMPQPADDIEPEPEPFVAAETKQNEPEPQEVVAPKKRKPFLQITIGGKPI